MVKPVQPFAFGQNSVEDSTRLAKPRVGDREPEVPLSILIIDDDDAILENLAETLRPPLFKTRTTNTKETFHTELETLAPDIVITDMAMPSHDGLDVLRDLRDRRFAGEVILMSGADGHVLETARRVAVSYGLTITGVLRKPFTPAQLMTLVGVDAGRTAAGDGVSQALSERRIRPYFQPKVDIKTGRIVGAEALSRWHHPERGLLLPQTYLNTKRVSSRSAVHDYTMLERAMEFCGRLNAIGKPIAIAVNFAADVILSDEFPVILADAQQRHGIAPEQLIIELTESDASEGFDELAERLLKIRLFGAHLSIDDFGTGQSSLSRLQRLPMSEIKIDRSFVQGLTEYSDNLAIVRSIIELAHAVHCPVVAEGVESVEALEALKKLGCEMAQGFLFSPAVNESTFIALLRDDSFNYLQGDQERDPVARNT